ncbi:MAG: hypothetical protein ACNA7W_14205, partial [Pseudomonadales bacterium]
MWERPVTRSIPAPRNAWRRLRPAAIALAIAAVVGCSGARVSVPPILPVPLVDQLPVTMGLH